MSDKAKIGLGCGLGIPAALVVLAIIMWWVVIMLFLPARVITNTFNIADQEITTFNGKGEEVKISNPFITINKYDNMFEVVLSQVYNEEQNAFENYAIQFFSEAGSPIEFNSFAKVNALGNAVKASNDLAVRKQGSVLNVGAEWCYQYNQYWSSEFRNLSTYVYSGMTTGTYDKWHRANDDEAKNITEYFNLQFTNSDGSKELMKMKLKGTDAAIYLDTDDFYKNKFWGITYFDRVYNYRSYDLNAFCASLFYKFGKLQAGTDEDFITVFGDYFYYYDDNGNLINTGSDKFAKIIERNKSCFSVHVNVHEGVADNANQSLVGHMYGVQNYNVTEENTFDYEYGRGTANLTDDDFVLTKIEDKYTLVLCDKFKNCNANNISKIRLNINIDLSKFARFGTIYINTGDFYVYKINDTEVNQKLVNYAMEVSL